MGRSFAFIGGDPSRSLARARAGGAAFSQNRALCGSPVLEPGARNGKVSGDLRPGGGGRNVPDIYPRIAPAAAVLRRARAALLVLALGLAVTLFAWDFTERRIAAEREARFEHEVAQAMVALERRLRSIVDLLIGLRGLFDASDQVSEEEFQRYLAGFGVAQRFPGVRALSYAVRVAHGERAAFEQRVRRAEGGAPKGFPAFAIHPEGTRDEYVVVLYVHPLRGNEAGLGLDLAADPVRRGELALARDSAAPVASGPFAATIRPGAISFAVRMAIYRPGAAPQGVAQRRESFTGVVAAVVGMEELVSGPLGRALGSAYDLVIHDLGRLEAASPGGAGALLYDSRASTGRSVAEDGGLSRTVTLEVGGRTWRLAFGAAAARGAGGALPTVVLLGGLVTSGLLFWLVWSLALGRERALELARNAQEARAAQALRGQLAFIQQLIEAVPLPIFFKDAAERRYLGVNAAWERFFGIPRERFLGKTVFDLYPDDPEIARQHHAKDEELFAAPGSQSYEATITAGGELRHTIYNKATFAGEDGRIAGLIGVITDVTELKKAEAALRESEARFRDLTELSSDWYWEQDEELRFTLVSSKIEAFSIHSAESLGKRRWELPCVGVTDEQWQAHKEQLARREPFQDFVYQRYDRNGELRTISVSGRPIFDEEGRFRGYRGIGRDITEQRRAEERIRYLAHHDGLTGLPNRMRLQDRIGQAIAVAHRQRRGLAVLFVDLDRFKNVNDSLGHHVGDELLRAVAARLGACVRETDTVSRIGGDEFVVLLTDLAHGEDARLVAQKILDSLSQPFLLGAHELEVTPSIGIAVYPNDGEDVETLLRNADAAMYRAKELGRDNYQFYTPEMNVRTHERLALERDLRHALERGELLLHYQPQVDVRTGAIVGFEALARWRHPERGLVPPSEFIRTAEETGLINPIGEFVLREACRQARAWHAAGYPELQVSVNCSAHQFRREGMVEAVRRLLAEVGLPPECLALEITESVMIDQPEQVIEWFRELRGMGLEFSLDDFGTGYASLSSLKRLPVRRLKIDRGFVQDIGEDPDDAAIVSAIIAMAHTLGMEVIAEGVETAEQLACLRSLGCDRAQGYYFSRPLPAEEFLELLREWDPAARASRR
jgi:diguanylate cyclase (GGDEF)-like protein/PAS domain S-box-containing protein